MFTAMDLFSGYWQVRLAESFKEKTSFVTKFGAYQFEAMLFGLMDEPLTFPRLMDFVVQDIPFARVYINNVVAFSQSIAVNALHIKEIVRGISKNGLKVKLSKCFLAQKLIKLLGHVFDNQGIQVDGDEMIVIKSDWENMN